jgi:hypothetical protein
MEDYTECLESIANSIDYVCSNLPDTPYFDTEGIERALSGVASGFNELSPRLGGVDICKSLENIDEQLTEFNETMDNQVKWLHDINISLRLLIQMKAYELSRSGVPMPDARGAITQPLDQDGNSPYWADCEDD